MFLCTFIIELTCLLLSVIFLLNKNQIGNWRAFIFYLLFIVLLEGTGWSLWFIFHLKNHWLYNIELPVTFIFIWFFFKKEFRGFRKALLWLNIGGAIFFIICFCETLKGNFATYNEYAAITKSLLFLFFSAIFYYLIIVDERTMSKDRYAAFWVVTGVFLSSFLETGINTLIRNLSKNHLFIPYSRLISLFLYPLVILYGCWCYAFWHKHMQRNKSSSDWVVVKQE